MSWFYVKNMLLHRSCCNKALHTVATQNHSLVILEFLFLVRTLKSGPTAGYHWNFLTLPTLGRVGQHKTRILFLEFSSKLYSTPILIKQPGLKFSLWGYNTAYHCLRQSCRVPHIIRKLKSSNLLFYQVFKNHHIIQ